jgi:NhaA family Na+:H+ antiporter
MATPRSPSDPAAPPGTWRAARHAARRLLAPVERFLAIEASAGLLLLGATVVALAWANSPWQASYEAVWHAQLDLHLGSLRFDRDLRFWLDDGLMTIFFFVVGLEIRRELHEGELSEPRRAALPFAAALGGMLVPAGIYAALNRHGPAASGWGVPMATDIAFAVGVLALLGKRVPPALRVLLLALAVIDDIGAIVVIALFYSSGIHPLGFTIAGAGVTIVVAMRALGVRSPWFYLAPGFVIWSGLYASGVHPTLAGVVLGLLTPARAGYGPEGSVAQTTASVEAPSPVERLLRALHPWVAYGIMPLFALANAGVPLGGTRGHGDGARIFAGVALGLVVGKPIGVLGVSWLVTRIGLSALPTGVRWRDVAVVATAAGIGFTMALFVGELAFGPGPRLASAKVAILCGSGVAATAAVVLGLLVLPREAPRGAAKSAAEAEASTTT